jgi:hypothetical protein
MTQALTFESIGIWVCVAIVLGQFYNSWRANKIAEEKLKQPQQTNITPQPLAVEMVKQFATKQELKELEEKFEHFREAVMAKIDEKFTELDNKRSRDVGKLHSDLRELSGQLQRLLGKLEK